MSDEEYARILWSNFTKAIDFLELQHAFEVAIHTAIMAERERCAKIAESFIPSGFREGEGKGAEWIGIARDDRARTIAHAIRNGEKPR